jgi:hypothetical protein
MLWYLGISPSVGHRLAVAGEVQSFKIGGSRRFVFDSVKQYYERCVAAGPQYSPPATGKRRVGRPKRQAASEASDRQQPATLASMLR